jgi:hypothetical protein
MFGFKFGEEFSHRSYSSFSRVLKPLPDALRRVSIGDDVE